MLIKQYVKSRDIGKVTFELPAAELPEVAEGESVVLVGEFNDWDPAATPMTYSTKKKAFRATLDLEPGHAYQFRYFVDNKYWCNDWQADAYVPTGLGHDNCVVIAPAAPEDS